MKTLIECSDSIYNPALETFEAAGSEYLCHRPVPGQKFSNAALYVKGEHRAVPFSNRAVTDDLVNADQMLEIAQNHLRHEHAVMRQEHDFSADDGPEYKLMFHEFACPIFLTTHFGEEIYAENDSGHNPDDASCNSDATMEIVSNR